MEAEWIMKLVRKERITDKDLQQILYDMCDQNHTACDSGCLMMMHRLPAPGPCPFFKDGRKMLKYLRRVL